MSEQKHIRTPLARVRGDGSARTGTSHFWLQRLTAVSNAVLVTAAIIVVITLLGRNQPAVAQILGSAPIAIIMLLFVISVCVHMKIGMESVIEDYVHDDIGKLAFLIANTFYVVIVGLAAIYGLLKLSFGL